MRLQDALEVMEYARSDTLTVEVNGVEHDIQGVRDTSQGVVIMVDTMQEAVDAVQASED
jgi:hypothetical protein